MGMSSGLEVIIDLFGFTEFGVFVISIIVYTVFGVLELFWIRKKCLFLCMGLARICCAC